MLYPTELRTSWMTIGRARTFSRFIRMAQQRSRCSFRPAWSSARNTKVRTWTSAATLIARCRSNTTDAYIAWGEFMDTDDSFVTVRTTGGTSQIGIFRTFTIDADILASVLHFRFCRSVHRQFVDISSDVTARTTDLHTPRPRQSANRPLTYAFHHPMTYETTIHSPTTALSAYLRLNYVAQSPSSATRRRFTTRTVLVSKRAGLAHVTTP